MRKVYMVTALLATTMVVAACGTATEENNTGGNMVSIEDINLDPVEVEVLAPDTTDLGEEVELAARVTQGDELVNDADEVTFEVWLEGSKSESVMIEAERPGDEGVYAVSHVFEEDGLYHVQPHTTARGMHVMPVHRIEAGDVADEVHEGEHTHDSAAGHDHGPMHESLAVDWQVEESVPVATMMTLGVAIDWEDAAWENGRVRFEIWRNGEDTRQWIDVEEVEAGVYEAAHAFDESGTYTVMVHLEDEEIHEHIAYEVEVTEE